MNTTTRPLVLDVDGTLLRTDMLLESFWGGLGTDPVATLRSLRHLGDRARLKAALAAIAPPRADLLPVNEAVLALARAARSEGRQVVLASASDRPLVEALSEALDLGGEVIASEGGVNLKGAAKAEALVDRFGEGGFDYAGNEAVDRAIWDKAAEAIVVGDPASAAALRKAGKPVTEIDGGWTWRSLIRSFRPHQWVKNVLLLLPMLAAHEFVLSTLLLVLAGIAAFSAAASCIYLVNDLLDLEADRLHSTKCRRPFASGAVPLSVGMLACLGLGALALVLGALLGPAFLLVVVVYMVLSLAYSLRLKRMRWVDIATLASLYTLRVVAGAAASGVEASVFMLIFIFPIFLTLGCVKRMTELALATDDARLPGRGYGRTDMGDLLNMSGIGVVGALVIFFLYSFSPQAEILYPSQWLLWVALGPITWWLMRMVRLGWQGKMDYDPIVFALRDKRGIGLLLMTLAIMFYAAGIWQRWFGF